MRRRALKPTEESVFALILYIGVCLFVSWMLMGGPGGG
jgi:hypothetical protein